MLRWGRDDDSRGSFLTYPATTARACLSPAERTGRRPDQELTFEHAEGAWDIINMRDRLFVGPGTLGK